MPLASLDLRRNRSMMAAITAAISAYLEEERQLLAPPDSLVTAEAVDRVVEPSFWRILKYMIFQR